MISYCEIQQCRNRKICTVYNTLTRYQAEILFTINSCQFLSQEQTLQNNTADIKDPTVLTERSKHIRELQRRKISEDIPSVAKTVRNLGMKFDVDGEEIS